MAHITLAGVLLDPTGEFSVGDRVRFTHQSTTGNTMRSAVSEIIVPPNGAYSINLEYGLVLVEYNDYRLGQYRNLGVATVNATNTATSIPELLNALVPVSSAELIQFQAIQSNCVAAQNAAAASAAAALVSQNAAAASAATLDLINDLSQAYIFDTVALFKASTIVFPAGKTIHLNDRQADFTVIAGTGTGNTFNVIASDNVSQSVSLLGDGTVSIVSVGAIGDASTDNQPAIQFALDNYLDVYIPAGTFNINTPVYVQIEGQVLRGAGLAMSKIVKVGVGAGVIGGNSSTETNNVHNMQIEELWLDGGTYPLQLGSSTSPLTYVGQVNSCRLTGGSSAGLFIYQFFGSISNCQITGNGVGLLTLTDGKPTSSLFSSCRFWNNTNQGALLNRGRGFTFDSCTFEANGREGVKFASTDDGYTWLKDITFNQCWFEQNMKDDIAGTRGEGNVTFNKTSGSYVIDYVHFNQCFFSGVKGSTGANPNVNIRGDVRNITLSHNTFWGPDSAGVRLDGTSTGIYTSDNLTDLFQVSLLQCITNAVNITPELVRSRDNTKLKLQSGEDSSIELEAGVNGDIKVSTRALQLESTQGVTQALTATPTYPNTGYTRLFSRDNGGVLQVVVQFSTGKSVVIADDT